MPLFKAPHHTDQTVFLKMEGLVEMSLTPGIDNRTGHFHIIESIKNIDEKEPFQSSIITEDWNGNKFNSIKQLYLYCRGEQASWEVYDEETVARKTIYNKFDAIDLAETWGKLADVIEKIMKA